MQGWDRAQLYLRLSNRLAEESRCKKGVFEVRGIIGTGVVL